MKQYLIFPYYKVMSIYLRKKIKLLWIKNYILSQFLFSLTLSLTILLIYLLLCVQGYSIIWYIQVRPLQMLWGKTQISQLLITIDGRNFWQRFSVLMRIQYMIYSVGGIPFTAHGAQITPLLIFNLILG